MKRKEQLNIEVVDKCFKVEIDFRFDPTFDTCGREENQKDRQYLKILETPCHFRALSVRFEEIRVILVSQRKDHKEKSVWN